MRAYIREQLDKCAPAIRQIIAEAGGWISGENIHLPPSANAREAERQIAEWQQLAADLKSMLGE
jgi:hypothetical protein